jgi:hypothetical protein
MGDVLVEHDSRENCALFKFAAGDLLDFGVSGIRNLAFGIGLRIYYFSDLEFI